MPKRSCIACHRKAPREELFRMVATSEGAIVPELHNRLPGRGSHCCLRIACIQNALKGNAFERALRVPVQAPEPAWLLGRLTALLEESAAGHLAAGGRKGAVAAGREAAQNAYKSGGGGKLFIATGLSGGSRREVGEWCQDAVGLPFDLEQAGIFLGRAPVGVLYVSDPKLAGSLALRVSQINTLGAG